MEDAPYVDCADFVRDFMPQLVKLLDKPYSFLGHSMGGLLAFEVTRQLRQSNQPLPMNLFISSTSGLNAYDKKQVDYTLSNEELVAMYPHLDMAVIGDAELQAMLMGILKADLQFLHSYQYTDQELLQIPIIAIHGNEDERVQRHQMEEWEKETLSSFRLIDRSGGHRYIQDDAEFVTQLIQEEMSVLIPVSVTNK